MHKSISIHKYIHKYIYINIDIAMKRARWFIRRARLRCRREALPTGIVPPPRHRLLTQTWRVWDGKTHISISISISIYLSIYIYLYLSIYLYIYLYTCLYIYLYPPTATIHGLGSAHEDVYIYIYVYIYTHPPRLFPWPRVGAWRHARFVFWSYTLYIQQYS